jgi:hypothetical protein
MTPPRNGDAPPFSATAMCVLCAIAMCYGWGWRGSYGHEAGAMMPGALLGMCICLASGRKDLHRRTPIVALCGAVGWAWGGALTNMEHTAYILSDSFPDVLYGFACIFLVGMLWSGMGAAVLAMGFTRPRSELSAHCRVLAVNGAVWLAIYCFFALRPDFRSALNTYGEEHFHDSEFFSATVIFIVSGLYWITRPKDRPQAALFVMGAVAWWLGYLVLTKWGGLLLAPPNRSEAWGGFVAVLIVFLVHHYRRRDRAATMMTVVAMITGGIAFDLALLVKHPLSLKWGPFQNARETGTWIWAEYAFGFFMGLGVAFAAVRLLRGGLRSPVEDEDRVNSDLFATFVLLVAMSWMNLKGNIAAWNIRYDLFPHWTIVGLYAWQWFALSGFLITALILYAFTLYRRGTLPCVPNTSFEKAFMLTMVFIVINQGGRAMHRFAEWNTNEQIIGDISMWFLAIATAWLVLLRNEDRFTAADAPIGGATPDDLKWRLTPRCWVSWVLVPVFLLACTGIATTMQTQSFEGSKLRFGENAFWKLELKRKELEQ